MDLTMDSRLAARLAVVAVVAMLATVGCATLPENTTRTASHAIVDTANTKLGRFEQEQKAAHPDQSGFLLLGNGLDAFLARAVLAESAERSIDAQYYLLHNDLTGRLFISELVKAADRGVRVRLLVDDMALEGRDFGAVLLESHPNIEVRIFNPFSRAVGRTSQYLTRFGSVTRRMHNKTFTVDNQATVLGGRNIGDEYFEANPDLAFQDLDVLAIGAVPHEVSRSFDKYWNHPLAYPVSTLVKERPTADQVAQARQEMDAFVAAQADSAYLTALRDSALAKHLRAGDARFYWGQAKVVADNPEKLVRERDQAVGYRLVDQLVPYFTGIKQELIIFSPYFVPGKEGTAFLSSLSERGVRVRILTNSLASTDVAVVHAGYEHYRKALLRAGVELYELNKQLTPEQRKEKKAAGGSSKASLHAKSFVLDRRYLFIGSMNLDPRSVVENSEIGVMLAQPELAGGMAEWFDRNIDQLAFRVKLETDADGTERLRWYGQKDGEPVVFDHEPYTGFWRRFGVGILSIFPVESQL
jgi:putative cardiolipin synthase